MVGRHSCFADPADTSGNTSRGSCALGSGACLLGRRRRRAWPGSIRRPRRRWRKLEICCGSSRQSSRPARITAHGRMLEKLGMHPRLAHMLVKSRGLGAAHLACDLAAILSERDILRAAPGARDADLRLRVAVLRGDGPRVARRRYGGHPRQVPGTAQLRKLAARLRTRSARYRGSAYSHGNPAGLGLSGSHRPSARRRRRATCWQTAGALALQNRKRSPNPNSSWRRNWTARSARRAFFWRRRLGRGDLTKTFRDPDSRKRAISAGTESDQAIRAQRERRLGALLLDAAEIRDPDASAMQAAALAGLKQLGIAGLPWTKELRQWRARVMLLHQYAVPAPTPWPDLSDAALAATLDDWAPPWIGGFTRREHFAKMDLRSALRSNLDPCAGDDFGAGNADAFQGSQRFGDRHRLSRRRDSDFVGAPAGTIWLARRRRPLPADGCPCCSSCCRPLDGRCKLREIW